MWPNLICDSIVEYASFDLPVLREDKKNVNDFYCCDLISTNKFAQNHGGYPRSDVALLNDTNNVELQKALVNKLVDYSSDSNKNAGLSDAEILQSVRSKYMQSPSEILPYIESKIADRDNRFIAAEAAKRSSENSIKFNESDKAND